MLLSAALIVRDEASVLDGCLASIEGIVDEIVLVDTGYGLRDVDHPHRHPSPRITLPWRMLLNIRLHERETAIRQIEALGFGVGDVRHIIATHLDFDHAGGLDRAP